MLEKTMNFIEEYGIDKKKYWVIKDAYGPKNYEIMFVHKLNNESTWSVREKVAYGEDEFEWEVFSKKEFKKYLSESTINIASLELEMNKSLLSEGVYAHHYLTELRELLGDGAVDEAIAGMEQFKKDFLDLINKTLNKSKLKLV